MLERKKWIFVVICWGILEIFCLIDLLQIASVQYYYRIYTGALSPLLASLFTILIHVITTTYIVLIALDLLRMKKWARTGAIAGIWGIIILAFLSSSTFLNYYLQFRVFLDWAIKYSSYFFLNLFIISYLTRPRVKQHFLAVEPQA